MSATASEPRAVERNGNGAGAPTKDGPKDGPASEAFSRGVATPPVEPATRIPVYRRTGFRIFITVVALLATVGVIYGIYAHNYEETDDAFVDGHIVPISPQVPALVAAIHIDDNQFVHKGDLLVELDPTDYLVMLAQSQGSEASSRGKLEQAKSQIPAALAQVKQAQAELDSAQVNFDNTDRDLKRFQGLDERAKSQQQLDNATAAQKSAQAAVEQAQAKLTSATSQVETAKANVIAAQGDLQKAEADTQRARVNLGYCRIVAPADGRITNKNVDPGMYVTTSSQLLQLVPSEVYITANYKETQLDRMRPGQSVKIHVDAFPGRDFEGKLQSIQSGTGSRFSIIPAENATGNFVKVVQRVPVKIVFDTDPNADPNQQLSPGMSVEPTVHVGG